MTAVVSRTFWERLLLLVLVLEVVVLWLRWRPGAVSGEAAILADLPSCTAYTSDVPERLIPTPVAGEGQVPRLEERPATRHTPSPVSMPRAYTLRWRVGISVPLGDPLLFQWPQERPGWYLNWTAEPGTAWETLEQGLGMAFTPMVRLTDQGLQPDERTLMALARSHPGRVWLIGNEPDVRWQDDATPEEYACYYYRAYQAIKAGDSTAQVAIGGLSQITPLRLRYLERVWTFYQEEYGREMPVDVWNMHAFVLPERADDWGVGIPPGFEGQVRQGVQWGVEDHDNLALVENQVRLMRQWMARHGQRDKPLYITEYGILLPPEYGFDTYRVVRFLVDSFDLFQRLQDPSLGYPTDQNRLVQRWNWFSAFDTLYHNGNLFDAQGAPTPLMRALAGYLRAHQE